MTSVIEFLKRKKTYIVAGAVALIIFAHLIGLIDRGTAEMILAFLGAGGLATLKAGQNRIEKKL